MAISVGDAEIINASVCGPAGALGDRIAIWDDPPVGTEDSRGGSDAHDVLAAEEFGVPAPDPVLHHGPVSPPPDPSGIAGPHDVLAAEEFALPAGTAPARSPASRHGHAGERRLVSIALGALLLVLIGRRLLAAGRAR